MSNVFDQMKPENNISPNKSCVSCGKDGHTYLACRERPFWPAVADAFGINLNRDITEPQNQPSTYQVAVNKSNTSLDERRGA